MTDEEAREEIENELKMSGWILENPTVIKEIDGSQNFIKVKLTNAGEVNKNYKDNVKSKEQFERLLNYLEKSLKSAGKRIIGGEIAVKPYKNDSKGKNICDYCNYSEVCGFENKNWIELPKLKDEEIWEKMEKDEKI